MINLKFLNRDVLNYTPRTVKPDILSLWPPTEVAEGYNYEAIQENFVITDNSRILRVYYVQPLQHVAGMLMAYLPTERIAFEADLFDTHEAATAVADASDAQLLQPGAADEARRGDDRTRARQAGAVEHVHDGAGTGGQDELEHGTDHDRRFHDQRGCMTGSGRHFLQIPGPTNVPDRVLLAMAQPDDRSSRP